VASRTLSLRPVHGPLRSLLDSCARVYFFKSFSSYITEFTSFNMGSTAREPSLRSCRDTEPQQYTRTRDKYLTHPTATAVRGEIVVFRVVDVDFCSLRESLENRPCAVRCDRRRPNVLIKRQQEVPNVLLTSLGDCIRRSPRSASSSWASLASVRWSNVGNTGHRSAGGSISLR